MTQLFSKDVITRKPHNCFACERPFPAKTKMNYQTNIYEGDIYSLYTCETCMDIMALSDANDYDDGFQQGFVQEQLRKGETPEWLLKRMIHLDRMKTLNIGDSVAIVVNNCTQAYRGFVTFNEKSYRPRCGIANNKRKLSFHFEDWPAIECHMQRMVLTEKKNKIYNIASIVNG